MEASEVNLADEMGTPLQTNSFNLVHIYVWEIKHRILFNPEKQLDFGPY